MKERIVLVLAVLTVVGLFAVNIVGFVDTETGSALGCGHDWPLCNGAVIPHVWGLKTLIEFSHRALVATVTVLLLITSVSAWVLYRGWVEVRALIAVTVGFVFVQAGLGALGVIYGDPPWFLAFHFGFSLLAFVGAMLLVIVLRQIRKSERRDKGSQAAGITSSGVLRHGSVPLRLSRLIWFTIVYMYGAMYFGAYVSSTGDGSAFRGWPFPTEAQSPSVFIVDIVHRSIAFGLILLILYLAVLATRNGRKRRDLLAGSWITFILALCLAFTGALLVWSHQVLWAFLLHISFVTFVFGALCYLALQSLPEPKSRVIKHPRTD
ncbi:heme A synthase [Alicyclobacillus sp. SO9]|uniref:COX15/CtaA family protein n=1 Tax=Alicyclobacillus sp. SO9 TaxID=2665646 RepID=UPI0018E81FC7|nr:COX15/CtaA family protein [Alicyclobacillus sp. SO9]QQE80638.1 COX15/CtaA family protein [Alicyclobacillus sp. SO9]